MLCFIPLLCVSSEKFYWVIAFMNILLIGKYTWFQINNKFEQIANVENEKVIEATIDEAYANYNDYSQYYFIDTGLQNYRMDKIYVLYKSDKQFIVISDRAKCNTEINQLYEKAVKEIEGYRLIESKNHINILIHE